MFNLSFTVNENHDVHVDELTARRQLRACAQNLVLRSTFHVKQAGFIHANHMSS
jgi:hypothetical protein